MAVGIAGVIPVTPFTFMPQTLLGFFFPQAPERPLGEAAKRPRRLSPRLHPPAEVAGARSLGEAVKAGKEREEVSGQKEALREEDDGAGDGMDWVRCSPKMGRATGISQFHGCLSLLRNSLTLAVCAATMPYAV
jgi:hypothetical protein